MRRTWLLTIVPLLLFSLEITPGENATDYVLIVNKANKVDSLSVSKLRFIYRRKVSRWPWGAEILPLDLPEQSPVRQQFSTSILGAAVDQLTIYWIDQKVTRNVNPPARVPTAEAAKAIVASKVGAIAYIPAGAVDATVKVLEVK